MRPSRDLLILQQAGEICEGSLVVLDDLKESEIWFRLSPGKS